MSQLPIVTNNIVANQFETDTGHGIARLKYVQRGEVLDLVHTDVPREAEGHGLGAALARAALEHARREGLQVIATCPFVAGYLKKHREFGDLVAAR